MKYVFKNRSCNPRAKPTEAGAVLGQAKPEDVLEIITDTREQNPLHFDGGYVVSSVGTVPVFDYALLGDENQYALERKSLQDYIGSVCLQKNWICELAKITKAKEWGLPIFYILEFKRSDILHYDYSIFPSGAINSQFVHRRMAEMEYDFGVHFIAGEDRRYAAYWICLILKRRREQLRILFHK